MRRQEWFSCSTKRNDKGRVLKSHLITRAVAQGRISEAQTPAGLLGLLNRLGLRATCRFGEGMRDESKSQVRDMSCKRPNENGAFVERLCYKTEGPVGSLGSRVAWERMNLAVSMERENPMLQAGT